MTCHSCQSLCRKFGKHRNGLQRYRCNQCRKSFTEDHAQPLGDMRLPMEKAVAILKLLVEGMSIRSIERVTQGGESCDGFKPRPQLALSRGFFLPN